MSEYKEWEPGVVNFISADLGPAYLAPFQSAKGGSNMFVNHNFEGDGWYALLQRKLSVLNSFIGELRRD